MTTDVCKQSDSCTCVNCVVDFESATSALPNKRRWIGVLKAVLRLLILVCNLLVLGLVASYLSRESIPGDIKFGNKTYLLDSYKMIVSSQKCTCDTQ